MNLRPTALLYLALLLGVALGLVVVPTAEAQLASSPWPMFQHDAQHSGRSSANGPQGPNPKLAWYAKTRSRLQAAVSVAPDLTIIAPNGKNPLSAFDPDTGDELWSSPAASDASARLTMSLDPTSPPVSVGDRQVSLPSPPASAALRSPSSAPPASRTSSVPRSAASS